MSDETTHQKILAFLSGELAKKDERQCIRIDLEFAPPGFRPDMLRSWVRADQPQYFDELVFVEQMVADMVEIAMGDADAAGSGARQYIVRTHQTIGQRMICRFRCAPSFESSDQALVATGGTGAPTPSNGHDMAAMQIISANNQALMRVNQAMYRDTFGTLADLSNDMRDENLKLRAENIVLRRELEDAKSIKEEKELEQMIRVQKNEQSNMMTTKILNIGSAIAARVIGGDMSKPGADPAPIMMLLGDFTKSLTRDQVGKLLGIMRQDQQVMLYSLMEMAMPKKEAQDDEDKKAG